MNDIDPKVEIRMCPPPCHDGKRCSETISCTPETCEWKQRGWECTANHVKHECAHDFTSGPWIEMDFGGTASCSCGMTAVSHDLRYAP